MARKNRRKHSVKSRSRLREEVDTLTTMIVTNTKAYEEGPKKKKWTIHDLKTIKPLTPAQEDLFHVFNQEKHICAHGSAGTGKTFLGLYLALREVLENTHERVIIVRSAVATRDIGFMPGDLNEKMSFYETPYRDICAELFGKFSTYDDMKLAGKIEFMPTTFIRGITWDNAIVVVDEGQNMTFHEINSIMTRVGKNTKIIFTGDMPQTDLRKNRQDVSGMEDFLKVIDQMDEFGKVHFTTDDIVRSDFVKAWIIATEKE